MGISLKPDLSKLLYLAIGMFVAPKVLSMVKSKL
jgi:hypothetical protein